MEVQLLDCTIRDGSCEVDFQFTAQDVAVLAAGLDQAGIAYIEAGHGFVMGTNAIAKDPRVLAQVGYDMTAALDDHEYFKVIRRVVRNAKVGALATVGFMGLGVEWLEMAADSGLDFLRIGMFADAASGSGAPSLKSEDLKKGMRLIKDRGLTLAIQMMQTYAQTLEQVADAAHQLVDQGADWIYVVDSAGGMIPSEVARYVEAIRQRVNARIGFHSHNNTQMALGNCLAAIDAGATLVDSSLQGVGRATGNAPTEGLLALLQNRRNMERGIDQNLLFNLGRNYSRPWVKGGFDPSHVLSGIGRIHSDRLHTVRKAAKAKGFGLDDVLVDVGTYFQEQGLTQRWTAETVASACETIAKKRQPPKRAYDFSNLVTVLAEADGRLIDMDMPALLKQLKVHAIRDRLKSILVFVRASLWPLAGPSVVVRNGWAIGAVPCERVDLASFEHHEWLHAIFADEHLPRAESTVPIRGFSLSGIVAEAATMRSRAAVSLVACEDNELSRDLLGRLWRGECVALERGQAAPNREFTAVYLQGKLGWSLLESPDFRAQLRPGMILQLLGSEPLSAAALQSVRQVELRLPDVWSVLVAFATLEDDVKVVDGASAVGPADARPYQIIAESGEILDWRRTAVIGRWAPLATTTNHDRLSISAIRELYEKRIARTFSNPLDP